MKERLRSIYLLLNAMFTMDTDSDFGAWSGGYLEGARMVINRNSEGVVITNDDLQREAKSKEDIPKDKVKFTYFNAARYVLYEFFLDWMTDTVISHEAKSPELRGQRDEVINEVKAKVTERRAQDQSVN